MGDCGDCGDGRVCGDCEACVQTIGTVETVETEDLIKYCLTTFDNLKAKLWLLQRAYDIMLFILFFVCKSLNYDFNCKSLICSMFNQPTFSRFTWLFVTMPKISLKT